MKQRKAAKLVKEYFDSLHVVLWGDFDISRIDRRAAAEVWFMNQLIAAKIVTPAPNLTEATTEYTAGDILGQVLTIQPTNRK